MTDIVVWHRADLRTVDNAALARATADGDRAVPVFVSDPAYYGDDSLSCDARLRCLHDCLDDLDEQYRSLGSSLAVLHGDARGRYSALADPRVRRCCSFSNRGRDRTDDDESGGQASLSDF